METMPLEPHLPIKTPKTKGFTLKKQRDFITSEDAELIQALNSVLKDLDVARQSFDLTNNEALTDSFIFEIMALNKRYEYYLKQCKERGLVAGGR